MPITDPTDGYFEKGWRIQFFHVPSGTTVAFKAFLTTYSDNFTSNWNEEAVFGRMDPLMTFQNTTRAIDLSWTLVAKDKVEAAKNLRNADLLLSMQYPSYDAQSASSMAAPPLFRVRFSNLIQEAGESLVCAIGGFTFAPDLEQGFFEGLTNQTISPKVIEMSCQLKVLHTRNLGWSTGDGRWRDRGGFAHSNSISISAARNLASGQLGDRAPEGESSERGPNPEEAQAVNCAILDTSTRAGREQQRACWRENPEGAREFYEARHEKHVADMEEAGRSYYSPGEREAAVREHRQNRREFRREQRRADRDTGRPRRSNQQLNDAYQTEMGWTDEENRAAFGPGEPL